MKVVILGAGTVGQSIAESLSNSRHVVTIVDRDPVLSRKIDEELFALLRAWLHNP